jgi:hypothetical protein
MCSFDQLIRLGYVSQHPPMPPLVRNDARNPAKLNKGCVTHRGLATYIKKYLKAKGELWKLKYFIMQKYNLQKIL